MPLPDRPLGVAIVGCGDVATAYATSIRARPDLALLGATDRNPPRVERFVAEHGGTGYRSLDDLLATDVDLVVNLTRQTSHYDVTRRCLDAGKHVYSEKPLALTYAECVELAELADRRGVRLGCAPITYLGAAQQVARDVVRSGDIGQVRVVYAEANWGQIERWHPRPQEFYAVGPTFDVGVYPLTLVTAFFGPAVAVSAGGGVVLRDRASRDGTTFSVGAPDFVAATVELACGVLLRLTCSFFVGSASRQKGLEIHGDAGTVLLDSWFHSDSPVAVSTRGGPARSLPLPGDPPHGADYARGIDDLADALRRGRPHQASAAHAAHVVEVVEAIHESVRTGRRVAVSSTFDAPRERIND